MQKDFFLQPNPCESYAVLLRYRYNVIAFNMTVPRRIAGIDAITLIVTIRAIQASAFPFS